MCPLHKNQLKIEVSLIRQSRIGTGVKEMFDNASIGKGEIWELPPGICKSSDIILDWEGELKPDVTVGGFATGNVSVRDFVVLALEPPLVDKNEISPFLPLRMTVPIRLVTDSFVEVMDYEPPPL
ncbi:hypothetical protein C0995_014739 [Termitomyces sp. Mi166|nr:hypothetical protein C0995_014739 [Termitomyces sp. Mi166\